MDTHEEEFLSALSRREFLRLVSGAAVVTSTGAILAACAPAATPTTAPQAPTTAPQAPTTAPQAPTTAPQAPAAGLDWAHQPMKALTPVVLSCEAGSVADLFDSYMAQVKQQLNIDLRVVPHPYASQYAIQYMDLSSQVGGYDLLSHYPAWVADYAPFLTKLADVAPGGKDQVVKDLVLDDVLPAYKWTSYYKGDIYTVAYDGDVKVMFYRHDLASDPKEQAGFKAKYGYDYNIDDLTWEQFLDVATWFNRPAQNFFGDAEIAGFLAGFFYRDRFVGMGGHYFDYDTMKAFPKPEIAIKAFQHLADTFNKASAPDAKSFEFEDARNQIIKLDRAMFCPQWPDVWKWANDPKVGSKTALGNVWATIMPGFKDPTTGKVIHRPDVNGGRVLTLNKASTVKEAAYKTIVFFADPVNSAKVVYNNTTWLDPWRVSHVNLDNPNIGINNFGTSIEGRKNFLDTLAKSGTQGYPALQIPGNAKYNEVIERWAKKAIAGQSTPQDATTGMTQEFESLTDQIGRATQLKEWQSYVDTVLKPLNAYP